MILTAIINLIILLFAPFLVIGVIKKTKAFWAGRKGVSLFQPWWDFVRLMKKDSVVSDTTTWIFRFTPILIFATTLFAGLFVPMLGGVSIVNMSGGFILFAYLLGLGKFFSLLSAMDTGSSFEGMGASREACFTTIVEPAFFIIMASLIALSGNFTFESLFMILEKAGGLGILMMILAVLALVVMLLTECCRVPVDDPTTHLELTMIHEVMILDNSGQDLGLITWAAGIKMVILESLIAALLIPTHILGFGYSALAYVVALFVIAIFVGTLESAIARLRMSHVFEFIFAMSSFALIILSLTAIKLYGN